MDKQISLITSLKRRINESLAYSLQQIKTKYQLDKANAILFESIKDFSLRKGKRIRPLLLVLSYLGYSPKNKKPSQTIFQASTCMELLHNFMLIHDDIIDRSNLRRGKPTLHRILCKTASTNDPDKLGADLSIIAGDIVYALAIDSFLAINEPHERKEKALKHFVRTAILTAVGEFIDITSGTKKLSQVTEEDIFLNYTLKTAHYTFECPLVVGAILAGAPALDIPKLSSFGIKIGQAFQIQDDIIGLYGSQKSIGKSILSDIAECKKTLPIWHAYTHLKGQKRKTFLSYFLKEKKTYQDLLVIRRILLSSQSLEYSLSKISSLLGESKKTFTKLHLSSPYKDIIWNSLIKLFDASDLIARKNKQTVHIP